MKALRAFGNSVIVLLAILLLPSVAAISVRLCLAAWNYDYGSFAPSVMAQDEEAKLERIARDDPTATNLLMARKSVEKASRIGEAVGLRLRAETLAIGSAEKLARRKDWSLRQVLVSEFRDDQGASASPKVNVGDFVRYYPAAKTRKFDGDTRTWCRISVGPHKEEDLYWVLVEGITRFQEKGQSRWETIKYPSDLEKIQESWVKLIPNEPTPILRLVGLKGVRYVFSHPSRKRLLWSINDGAWESIPEDGPDFNGPFVLKFLWLGPEDGQKEQDTGYVRVTLRRSVEKGAC